MILCSFRSRFEVKAIHPLFFDDVPRMSHTYNTMLGGGTAFLYYGQWTILIYLMI